MRAPVLVLVAACGSGGSASSTTTAPTTGAPAESSQRQYIDPGMCKTLASSWKTHCAHDEKAMLDQCMAYARLAEAASCVPAAQRSFDCALAASEACSDKACCSQKGDACTDGDRPFDGCMRGYCSGQPGHPDCVWFKD